MSYSSQLIIFRGPNFLAGGTSTTRVVLNDADDADNAENDNQEMITWTPPPSGRHPGQSPGCPRHCYIPGTSGMYATDDR